MGAKTPAIKTVHDLNMHMQGLGHPLDIATPLRRGQRTEATCLVCQGRITLRAHNGDVEAAVTPDLLEPCRPRPLVTFLLEATFQPSD